MRSGLHSILLAWMLAAGWTTPAGANQVELTWSAPPQCPDREWVLARVNLPDESPNRLSAHAVIVKQGDGYVLDLSTKQQGEEGKRTLTAQECEELAEVAAALLSLALATSAQENTESKVALEASPTPTESESEPIRWWGALGVRGSIGQLPAPRMGPVLSLGVGHEDFMLEGRVFAFSPFENHQRGFPTTTHSALVGALSLCTLRGRRFVWGACLGSEIGAHLAEARDISQPNSRTDLWFAPHAQVIGGCRWGDFALHLRPGVGIPLIRPAYRIEPYGIVHQPAPVYGSLELTLGLLL